MVQTIGLGLFKGGREMSVQPIIQALEALIDVHEAIYDLSVQKTEAIKEGKIEALQALLIKERKKVQSLENAEKHRQSLAIAWFEKESIPQNDATVSTMLDRLTDEKERNELETKTIALTEAILKIKQQEQLNQALIAQSMQFVQLSLDMISPSLKNMNYGNNTEPVPSNRSMFDSKA